MPVLTKTVVHCLVAATGIYSISQVYIEPLLCVTNRSIVNRKQFLAFINPVNERLRYEAANLPTHLAVCAGGLPYYTGGVIKVGSRLKGLF